jgi:hypothetical protein
MEEDSKNVLFFQSKNQINRKRRDTLLGAENANSLIFINYPKVLTQTVANVSVILNYSNTIKMKAKERAKRGLRRHSPIGPERDLKIISPSLFGAEKEVPTALRLGAEKEVRLMIAIV